MGYNWISLLLLPSTAIKKKPSFQRVYHRHLNVGSHFLNCSCLYPSTYVALRFIALRKHFLEQRSNIIPPTQSNALLNKKCRKDCKDYTGVTTLCRPRVPMDRTNPWCLSKAMHSLRSALLPYELFLSQVYVEKKASFSPFFNGIKHRSYDV